MISCSTSSNNCLIFGQDVGIVFVRIFNIPHIYELIVHNYRSNQSVLMTRCGTDLRHQYGIFCGESQPSFFRNVTRGRSKEGRLFSQAKRVLGEEESFKGILKRF